MRTGAYGVVRACAGYGRQRAGLSALAVALLDLVVGGVAGDPEHLVKVLRVEDLLHELALLGGAVGRGAAGGVCGSGGGRG